MSLELPTTAQLIQEQLNKELSTVVVTSIHTELINETVHEFYTHDNPLIVLRYRRPPEQCSVTVRFTDDAEVQEYFYESYTRALGAFLLAYRVSDGIRQQLIKIFGKWTQE